MEYNEMEYSEINYHERANDEVEQKQVKSLMQMMNEEIERHMKKPVYDFRIRYNAEELYNMNVEKVPCLFGDIIPGSGVWTLVGSSDTGKSMLLRQLAMACVKGEDFMGWQNNAVHKKSIYIATEDDAASTSYLIRRQSPSTEHLRNVRFYFTNEDIPAYLERELSSDPADLVIIDAWSDVFGHDLKDSALIRQTLNIYNTIAGKYRCSICFLHHTGKRTEKLEPSKNNILSGQGYEAKMRLVIEMRADADAKSLRHLCIVKGNYLGNEYKHASYVLHFDAETFRFSNTGNRVLFDDLTRGLNDENRPKKNTPFNDMPAALHAALVKNLFATASRYQYAEASSALANIYAAATGEVFGRDRGRMLLTYLVENNYVKKSGPDGHSIYQAAIT